MQHFKCAPPSACTAAREIGFRSDFASVHQLLSDCADEAHVDSEAEAKILILCIVSIEGGMPRPLRSLSNSASRDSVIFEAL